ncbi:hypothetical protein [Candidatus Tisiphia endosymbiont of Ptychoptera albimana]|uniref:hypothetical protein n=1 Tax=Candidatus Tisiphia endosymbiont of Ptychoptera albimana TaxID=3066260 RepID=UPI001DEDFC29|nr:hypothetical protein [Rickettsia endosymbiont of Sericostoma sp. HW-2014]
MAKKQKLLKNLLTSVSVASIVASIGGSSGAFAAIDLGGGPAINLSGVHGFAADDGDSRDLVFDQAGVTLTVDTGVNNIRNITATEAGNIIISQSIEITGRIVRGVAALDRTMATSIDDNKTLTLSAAGADHTGLGAVTLNGANATLTIANNAIVHNTIKGAGVGQGILNLGVGSTVNEEIGSVGNSLATVNIAGGEVNISKNVFATNTNLIAGSVLKLAAGKTITGNITTNADGKGTLTFIEAGTVTGNIGADVLALAEINITDPANAGPAVVQLKGDVYTKKLNFVTNNQVEIAGNFGGGAKVGGAAGAASAVDFAGVAGTLTFNGAVGDLKTFNATIANSANSILNV